MLLRLAVMFVILTAVVSSASAENTCRDLLQKFRHQPFQQNSSPYTGSNMLFFLHIPRTAGGTLNCLLRAAFAPQLRCPTAYKTLPGASILQNCTFVASHDDFSVMQRLPPGAAVITELRDPEDRVLSAYEFAIEQAAQRINKTEQQQTPPHLSEALAMSLTEDVWPWNYLVPFFVADMMPRITKLRAVPLEAAGVWTIQRNPDGTRFYYNRALNASKAQLSEEEQQLLVPELDAYDNDVVMPLKEFLQHPVAADLLHNGEILQVLGLTNYSSWPKAAALKTCMLSHTDIAEELLQVAKERLESFAYVGATSKLQQSIEELLSALGKSFNQTAHPLTRENLRAAIADAEGQDPDKDQLLKSHKQYLEDQGETSLSEEFYKCAAAGRTGAHNRRGRNLRRLRLNDWRQLYFDKQDRQALPTDVLDTIRRMNALDDELFKHAQHLMTQQRKRLEASGKLQLLPPRTVTKTKSAPLQGSKLLAALKAPAKSSSTKTGVAAEVSSIEELDVGASRPLNNVDRQRIQGHIMQKLQQLLSSKGTSEL